MRYLTFFGFGELWWVEITLLRLFVHLYADDTIIQNEKGKELQTALERVSKHCTQYNRVINCSKTKFVIFFRSAVRKAAAMSINERPVESVDSFSELVVIFIQNNTFQLTIKINIGKAR